MPVRTCVCCHQLDVLDHGQSTCWPCLAKLMAKLGRLPTAAEQADGQRILSAAPTPTAVPERDALVRLFGRRR